MFKRFFTTVMILLLSVGFIASKSEAVSEAAALFLRIAPGARAGGMGEAFVAVADDATTTHWNPAGLGAYPLAQTWKDVTVPEKYRPLKAIAALKKGAGVDYQSYELWAITPQGLMRYDNRKWYAEERFTVPASQTLNKLLSSYFRIKDDSRLEAITKKVAEANSPMTLEQLKSFRDTVMSFIPEDYSALSSLIEGFDSLETVYNECRINWERVTEAQKRFQDGMKDSTLTETECDRINVAIEKSKSRFLPEELLVPYSSYFDGEITTIASNGHKLLVGTTVGLYSYDGKRWRNEKIGEEQQQVGKVNYLLATPWLFYIGTDNGLLTLGTNNLKTAPASQSLPQGPVTAIGAEIETDVWVVINNDIYHYDGKTWTNSFTYTVALDENLERIAEKFSIYRTADEKKALIEKIRQVNEGTPIISAASPEEPIDSQTVADASPEEPVDSQAVADTTGADSTAVDSTVQAVTNTAINLDALNPGDAIRVPYITKIKGEITCIYPTSGNHVWVGTEYGALYFDGHSWKLPGYKWYTVAENENLDSLIANVHFKDSATMAWYRQTVIEINNLNDVTLQAGQEVRIPINATASKINLIRGREGLVYIASEDGLRAYDGQKLFAVSEKGMDKASVIYIEIVENELWLASDKEIVAKANGHNELSLMHVKWLPELASDIYYEFISFVGQIQGWGTVGGNITYLTYGTIALRDEQGNDKGTDEPFEVALTLSYGTSLTRSLKGGISAKIIYSRLSDQEIAGATAGTALGRGKTTGLAVDLGLLYQASPRLTFGMAITNLGPNLQYSQQSQADALPRNLALGFSYKLLHSDYTRLLVTAEVNKLLVDIGSLSEELRQTVINGGAEFVYANLIAARLGYIYDQEGRIKTPTLGVGLTLLERAMFDFSYIPSSSSVALANTLRMSLTVKL